MAIRVKNKISYKKDMKIISNFKDYYDKTLMYGADDSIKYIDTWEYIRQ